MQIEQENNETKQESGLTLKNKIRLFVKNNRKPLFIIVPIVPIFILIILVAVINFGSEQKNTSSTNDDEISESENEDGICKYEGEEYKSGDEFESEDMCNTCTCEDGTVSCTKKACELEEYEAVFETSGGYRFSDLKPHEVYKLQWQSSSAIEIEKDINILSINNKDFIFRIISVPESNGASFNKKPDIVRIQNKKFGEMVRYIYEQNNLNEVRVYNYGRYFMDWDCFDGAFCLSPGISYSEGGIEYDFVILSLECEVKEEKYTPLCDEVMRSFNLDYIGAVNNY